MREHARAWTSLLSRQSLQQFVTDMKMLGRINRPATSRRAARQEARQDQPRQVDERATRPKPENDPKRPAKNETAAAAPKGPDDDPTEARFKDAASA